MKKNLIIVRTILVGLFFSTVLSISTASAATKATKVISKSAIEIKPSLECLDIDETSALLHVTFDNAPSEQFELSVADASGEMVFSQDFEGISFSKYIRLVNEGGDTNEPVVVTIRLANGTAHSFTVTPHNGTVKEVNINNF